MAQCVTNLASILPDCFALTKPGGVRDFVYLFRRADLRGLPVPDTTSKLLVALDIVQGKVKKVQGRKFQNGAAYDAKVSGTGVTTYEHKPSIRIYHSTQLDREAIEQMVLCEDTIVAVPTNAGQIEIYGLTLGLKLGTGKGGAGIKLDDDNTFLLELIGQEPKLPQLFQAPDVPAVTGPPAFPARTGIDASIAYFDALVGV